MASSCSSLPGRGGREAEFLRPCKVLIGLALLALLAIDQAAVVIGMAILGVEADGLIQVGQRLVVHALVIKGEAAVAERFGRFGVEADGRGVVGQRMVVVGF